MWLRLKKRKKKRGHLNHESHCDSDFMFYGVAAAAAFGSVLLWVACVYSHCQCICVFIFPRNGSGI